MNTEGYTITKDLSGYNNHKFDYITVFDIEFSVEEQKSFLSKIDYNISCLTFTKVQKETDEFYASTHIINKLVALKEGEELVFDTFMQFSPQELSIVFKKEICELHKKRLLNIYK